MTDEQKRRIVSRLNGRSQTHAFEAARAGSANAVGAGEVQDKWLEQTGEDGAVSSMFAGLNSWRNVSI